MNKTTEALKMAIEALETNIIECRDLTSLTDALIACKEALESQEHKPIPQERLKLIEHNGNGISTYEIIPEIKSQKPLSAGDIKNIVNSIYKKEIAFDLDAIKFARAIEQAHGIK